MNAASNFPALDPFHHCADGILRVFDEPGGTSWNRFRALGENPFHDRNIRLRRVGAEFSASAPLLMSNLPGYNPVAGPCTIRVKKTKPWKVISPLRHTAASILYALAFG